MLYFKKKDNNFIEAIKILNSLKIDYWICHGTLLGIIRNKSPLTWDPDIDIGVWKKDLNLNKIITEFKKKGFLKKKKFFLNDNLLTFSKFGNRDIDINLYEISNNKNFAYQRHFAIKNLFMRLIYILSVANNYSGRHKFLVSKIKILKPLFLILKNFFIKKKIFYSTAGFFTPKKYFKFKKKIFYHEISVPIPYKYAEYLKCIYGKNWRKPQKNYNWEKNPNVSHVN